MLATPLSGLVFKNTIAGPVTSKGTGKFSMLLVVPYLSVPAGFFCTILVSTGFKTLIVNLPLTAEAEAITEEINKLLLIGT